MNKMKITVVAALAFILALSNIVAVAEESASTYLSPTEQGLVNEMNLARTQPRQYAEYLIDLRQHYDLFNLFVTHQLSRFFHFQ